jgi:hypothetical protein
MNEPQSPRPQPQPPSQPPSDRIGMIGELTNIIKGLSLTHVLIIALLVLIAAPTFILYRFLTDASLLNKWTSFYEELSSDKVGCTLRIASQRGADPIYSISTGFAVGGSDRYTVGVILTHQPDQGQLVSYCEVLNKIVDHMRRPEQTKSPTFPNSDEPLIWRYPSNEQP